ncbi:MAG: hypothetical protein R2873_27650 [Caldilineaceae bacterium]
MGIVFGGNQSKSIRNPTPSRGEIASMRYMLSKPRFDLWPDGLMLGYLGFLFATLATSLFAAIYFVRERLTVPFPIEPDPALVECDEREYVLTEQPDTHYLYSERFGWFDASHFYTGNPAKIIEDVRSVARRGGVIVIEQGVRDGLTGYRATYRIARNLPQRKVTSVALGIYLDWSRRFEEWEDQPPRAFFGPLTSFAVEDLPSHYIGFFASIHNVEPAYVLACYLGDVEAVEVSPPRLVYPEDLAGTSYGAPLPVQHLTNKTFTPMVWGPGGWRNIPWPKSLRMEAIGSSSGFCASTQTKHGTSPRDHVGLALSASGETVIHEATH